LASTETSILSGITLLSVYSLGLAIPFIISGILISKFLEASNKLRNKLVVIQKICGVMLLATGIGILTGTLQRIGFFFFEHFPFLSSFS
jgi:cytochrome c-type biogenesis protein